MNSLKINRLLSHVALMSISIACLFIFTRAGVNKDWFEKICSYWDDYKVQSEGTATIEQIKEERLGASYMISKMVKKNMDERHVKNPVILLEPNTYLEKAMGVKMPEPVIFYYYVGIKALLTNSSNVKDATHILRLQNGSMRIDTIASPEALQQIINFYKPYAQSL